VCEFESTYYMNFLSVMGQLREFYDNNFVYPISLVQCNFLYSLMCFGEGQKLNGSKRFRIQQSVVIIYHTD